jgi:hypothetical protein
MLRTITLLICLSLLAAAAYSQKLPFVRVFDGNGLKIAKGRLVALTDTSLQLMKDTLVTVPVRQIGSIRTKRSGLHNVGIGTAVSSAALATLFMATADSGGFIDWTIGEGAVIGTVIGIPVGAAIGGISTLFKGSQRFVIDGRAANWKIFSEVISSQGNKATTNKE